MATWGGVRGLAQAFMRSAVESGLGAAGAIQTLQEAGLSYRRTDMLADYRQYAGIPAKTDLLKYIRQDYHVSQSIYTETKGYQRSPFRYQVGIKGYNKTTGEDFVSHINVASDVELTRRQAEEAGYDTSSAAGYVDDIEVTEVTWEVASYNEDATF